MSQLHAPTIFVLLVCLAAVFHPSPVTGQTLAQRIQQTKASTRQKTANLENSAASFKVAKATGNLIERGGATVGDAIDKTTDGITYAAKSTVNLLKNITASSIDKGADFFMEKFLEVVESKGNGVIDLPDIDTKLLITSFKASGGYFKNLMTLRKINKIDFNVRNNSAIIEIPLKMTILESGYTGFKASAWPISVSGSFSVSVDDNEFIIRLGLQADKDCILNVEQMELVELSGLKVNFEGICGLCSTVVSNISTSLANFLENIIKSSVQSSVDSAISQVLEDYPLMCSKFLE